MKQKAGSYDQILTRLTIVALVVGLLFVLDAGFPRGVKLHKDSIHDFKTQLIAVIIGAGMLYGFARLPYQFWRLHAGKIMMFNTVACCLVLVFGRVMNHAKRWFASPIPHIPLNFQPAETAKLALIFFLAAYFANQAVRKRQIKKGKQSTFFDEKPWILPAVYSAVMIGSILREPDMGTAVIITVIALTMMWLSAVPKKIIFSIILATSVLSAGFILSSKDRTERFYVWLHPGENQQAKGYQPWHGMLAVGSGKLVGVHIAEGREKWYLPAATTDYIFATIAEETGFIGSTLLIGLLGWIVLRCFYISKMCTDPFGSMVVGGIGAWIGFQSIMNIGMVSGLLPSIGVPLPFISYGGSSLVSLMIAIGVVQSVSRFHTRLEVKSKDENSIHRRGNGRAYDARIERRVGRTAGGR